MTKSFGASFLWALCVVGLAFRLFEETLLKISLRYHKQGNGFKALILILVPDTPQIMRFLCISLHQKLSGNLVCKENVQRNIWKLLGFCDRLKQQYSHSRGFVPLCRNGWRDEGRRELHLLWFPQSMWKPPHPVEKCVLWTLVALHTAGIKRCGLGRISGLLSSCLWDCIYLQALCGHEDIN